MISNKVTPFHSIYSLCVQKAFLQCFKKHKSVVVSRGCYLVGMEFVYLTSFFADDSLLFCQTIVEECQQLINILGLYEATSGQATNRGKTTFFFSKNTRVDIKEAIQNILGAQFRTNCEKYLGLPMVASRSKVKTFKGLQDKIAKRVMGWKDKFISKADKEILIKIVAQVIPT